MSYQSTILSNVKQFYQGNHFNSTSDLFERRHRLSRSNIVKNIYPDLHNLLRKSSISNQLNVLDAGCGVGWLSYSLKFFYQLSLLSIDQSHEALAQAFRLCSNLKSQPIFTCADIFGSTLISQFDLIISMGVLHHTHSAYDGILKLIDLIKGNGILYIGLYHKPSRKHFFDYLGVCEHQGPSRDRFAELFQLCDDGELLDSWYHDQCLHVHETQHTLQDIWNFAVANNLRLVSTSLNKFKSSDVYSESYCAHLDHKYQLFVKKSIYESNRFLPGFFTVSLTRNTDI